MSPDVVVHGFETSNNFKVRIALGYKRIPYAFRTIDPADRREIVRLSGQHLTPVLVHGDRVLFDSAAILRYLDANFPDTPKLFGAGRDEQWAIEDWEMFARSTLAAPMTEVVHHRVAGGTVEVAMQTRCAEAFGSATLRVAEAMRGRSWLVGERMSAADVTAAAILARVRISGLFAIPDAAADLAPWIDRVVAFDGPSRVT